jgi:hypothetical protein
MGIGDRRRERRGERRGTGRTTYRMRQKLVAIGDDYWIEDEEGRRVFKVNGKAVRFRDTFLFEDASGKELLKLQERKLHLRDTMVIEDPSGRTVATVKVHPGRDARPHGEVRAALHGLGAERCGRPATRPGRAPYPPLSCDGSGQGWSLPALSRPRRRGGGDVTPCRASRRPAARSCATRAAPWSSGSGRWRRRGGLRWAPAGPRRCRAVAAAAPCRGCC